MLLVVVTLTLHVLLQWASTRRDNAWAWCSVFALVPDLFFVNLFLNRRKIAQNKFCEAHRILWASELTECIAHVNILSHRIDCIGAFCEHHLHASRFRECASVDDGFESLELNGNEIPLNMQRSNALTRHMSSSACHRFGVWMHSNNVPMVHSMLNAFPLFLPCCRSLCIWWHLVWGFKLKYILVRCRLCAQNNNAECICT